MAIEEQILINIARHLRRHDSLLTEGDIQAWQTESLNDLNMLTEESIRFIARRASRTEKEVNKALDQAGFGELREQESIMKDAAQRGRLREAPPLRESSSMLSILESYERQARNKFNLVNTTMIDQTQRAYLDVINRTTGEVLAGVSTPQQARRKAISQWAQKGIPALVDSRGREWSTEAYVSMVMRSTSNNVANEMQDARMGEYGVDLIEISAHAGARPKCEPYQGRVFSKSGNSNKFPPLSITSYGDPGGLFGVNCGHVKYPYIDGISRKGYEPYPKRENDRIYENSQKQRYLEREIRHAKRELSVMEELGDQEGIAAARSKVRDRQSNMRTFIDDTGRTRRRDREQIV